MHNAPPVAYPLGRSLFQGWALAGLWLAGLLVTAFWWLAGPGFDWRTGLAVAAVVAAGVLAWLGWRSAPVGQLHWDGQAWFWESPGYQAGTPVLALSVALDLQRTLLIRLDNHDHASMWLWAHRSAFPERWLDLRRAVYSRRKAWPAGLPPDMPLPVAAADFPAETDPPRPYP
ncbi:MAG: hypothetical protein Q7T13_11690 [Polaromonas sp.]|nr:hypothetical protein [Polaromonas sp.]